jgi:predicted nuclease of predicted toxin-antitoxin system
MVTHQHARVRRVIASRNHECWTVAEANLAQARDDDITIYAMSKNAVVVTHDVEFSRRREHNAIGRHLQLACAEPDAPHLLALHFDDVVRELNPAQDAFVRISASGLTRSRR